MDKALLLGANDLIGLLAERDRLRVVAALVLGADRIETIRDMTGLDYATISKALQRLMDKGLVEHDESFHYVLLTEAFQLAARMHGEQRARGNEPDLEPDTPEEEAKVLRTFFRDGRLTKIPVPWSKKLIVFEYMAQQFEPGQRYSESMVNLILGRFHADTAALRRYLVDLGLMDRDGGQYWRSGDRVGST